MTQRVRIPHRGQRSFVCHTTPHLDSTSRRVSYSVGNYYTGYPQKSKALFPLFSQKNTNLSHPPLEKQE